MNNFISYKKWLNEVFVDYVSSPTWVYGGSRGDVFKWEVIKNPHPNEIPASIRAIGDYNGNIWVALNKENWIVHTQLWEIIKSYDSKIEPPYESSGKSKTIALQRIYDYDVFGLGEGYSNVYSPNINTWKKLKEKNSEWLFINKKVTYTEHEDIIALYKLRGSVFN